ncbi:hypothetical protein [Altererythrobacter sp. GH1-8]|uniref:hypothetical protein n=1 Tax=Altererythrobacter sp. GH1-8 TaxID=3349333 RepID=UPI00374D46AF
MAETVLNEAAKAEIERRWPALPLWRVARIAEVYREDVTKEAPEWRAIVSSRHSLAKLQSNVAEVLRQLKNPSTAIKALLAPSTVSQAHDALIHLQTGLKKASAAAPLGTAQKWWRRYLVGAVREVVEEYLGSGDNSAIIALVQIIINSVEEPDFSFEQAKELVKQY